jgi:hypothetical protein
MLGSMLYSLVRLSLDLIAINHGDHGKLQGEVLALRRQLQVLEPPDQASALDSG